MKSKKQLVPEAKRACSEQGHILGRFSHDTAMSAYAYCTTGCGMGVFISTARSHAIAVTGRAPSTPCPNAVIGAKTEIEWQDSQNAFVK